MNPLDREEFSAFLQIINKQMPLHTEKTARIPKPQFSRFPKDLMEFSTKTDEKFLNNNLATIEEINHRDSKHWFPRWFREYQNKIYGNREILNHDNFFKAKLHDSFFKYSDEFGMPKNTKHYRPMSIMDTAFVGRLVNKVNGADLVAGSNASHMTGFHTLLLAHQTGSGVIGTYYDRLALNIFSAVGNERLGHYADSGSTKPSALLAETGSIASVNGFNWQSVSEYQLTTVINWVAIQTDSGSNDIYHSAGGNREYKSWTYGAFENPITGTTNSTTNIANCKAGHS